MFSKRTEPRAIATQLVLSFTVAAALLLSCGLGIFYWMVVRHAAIEDRAVLLDRVSALVGEIERSGELSAIAAQLQTMPTGHRAISWTRIQSTTGEIIAESRGMQRLLPPDLFPAPQTPQLLGSGIRNYRQGDQLFSLVAASAMANRQVYTIQVAQDRTEDEHFRRQFQFLFAAIMALGLLAAALIAVTATKRGLRPLAEMRHSLERIGPTRLDERIEVSKWPRELQPLALAFDDMMARLENSFLRLSQFSADLAHELRTPLGNILGEAQVTLSRARSPDEYRAAIESTVTECERLSAIVDNLLFLARAEAADRQIHRTHFAARTAAEKIATFYETVAEDRGVTIVCNGDGDIYADPLLFSRALSNIVDNALQFTPRGGRIEIALSRANGQTEVAVSDTGSGISSEHLPRVFDRFYRADPSRSSRGAGLGLALVKSIVDLHGGTAAIESATGSGTTMRLCFPGEAERG